MFAWQINYLCVSRRTRILCKIWKAHIKTTHSAAYLVGKSRKARILWALCIYSYRECLSRIRDPLSACLFSIRILYARVIHNQIMLKRTLIAFSLPIRYIRSNLCTLMPHCIILQIRCYDARLYIYFYWYFSCNYLKDRNRFIFMKMISLPYNKIKNFIILIVWEARRTSQVQRSRLPIKSSQLRDSRCKKDYK